MKIPKFQEIKIFSFFIGQVGTMLGKEVVTQSHKIQQKIFKNFQFNFLIRK